MTPARHITNHHRLTPNIVVRNSPRGNHKNGVMLITYATWNTPDRKQQQLQQQLRSGMVNLTSSYLANLRTSWSNGRKMPLRCWKRPIKIASRCSCSMIYYSVNLRIAIMPTEASTTWTIVQPSRQIIPVRVGSHESGPRRSMDGSDLNG